MSKDDPILDALDDLVAAGRDNVVAWMSIMARIDAVRELRRRGIVYKDMTIEGVPIIDAISSNQERLTAAAARFRRTAARQLHAEGLSPAAIARAFGVSRQRVANLLADHGPNAEDPETVAAAPQQPLSPDA